MFCEDICYMFENSLKNKSSKDDGSIINAVVLWLSLTYIYRHICKGHEKRYSMTAISGQRMIYVIFEQDTQYRMSCLRSKPQLQSTPDYGSTIPHSRLLHTERTEYKFFLLCVNEQLHLLWSSKCIQRYFIQHKQVILHIHCQYHLSFPPFWSSSSGTEADSSSVTSDILQIPFHHDNWINHKLHIGRIFQYLDTGVVKSNTVHTNSHRRVKTM